MTKLVPGTNDLATVNKELAKEWHPYKNNGLTPADVTAGAGKKVWWIGKCGHEWEALIDSRTRGRGCPYCSNAKLLKGFNDLAAKNPELVKEWNWEKNEGKGPDDFLAGSHTRVWWKCSECKHEWQTEVRLRSQLGRGCPECGKKKMAITFRKNLLASGKKSFEEEYPELAKEWHPEKNDFAPSDYTSSSGENIWWKCAECGYEWHTSIGNRVYHKSGCPLCAGSVVVPGVNDLKTLYPALAAEWHPTKNLPKTADHMAPASRESVWWICKYGHEYKCRVADRQKGVGCAECSKRFRISLPEKIVEYYIKQAVPGIISNYRPSFLQGMEIDIYNPASLIGIEYDGQRYHQSIERDKRKDLLCNENGICLIRIREKKCPIYTREDPTFILKDQKDESYSQVIRTLLLSLGIQNIDVDVSRDKQLIMESFRDTAISGSIAEDYPSLAKEWHPTLNGGLKPDNIPSTKSHDRYTWQCNVCGYSWKAALGERISGSGCPACAGKVVVPGYNDLATTHPDLAKEWHPMLNGNLRPEDVSKGQTEKVWWRCLKCGNEWQAEVRKRVAGAGCKKCSHREWGNKQYKPVYQFSKEGVLLKEYPSARIAAEEVSVSRVAIQHACTGRLQSAGGYLWSYYSTKELYVAPQKRGSKAVCQLSPSGELIQIFENAIKAAESTGISQASIRHACNGTHGRKSAGGFIWHYQLDELE